MTFTTDRHTSFQILAIAFLAVAWFLSSCSSSQTQENLGNGTLNPNTQDEAYPVTDQELATPADPYPAPTQDQSDVPYPVPSIEASPESGYPSGEVTEDPNLIVVAIDRPVAPGSQEVTGVGPPGLNIFIFNITLMGELLGSGIIADDGTFTIQTSPLEENVRIGLTTSTAMAGQLDPGVRPGEGEMNIPQIGYFYDSTVIR